MKRLRREANADIMIEDYVAGSDERVMSVILHKESIHYSPSSGGEAMAAIFDNFCEIQRDMLSGTASSEDQDTVLSSPDAAEESSMNGNTNINDGEEYAVRMLIDSSRKWPIETLCIIPRT